MKKYILLLLILLLSLIIFSYTSFVSLVLFQKREKLICMQLLFPQKVKEGESFNINVYCENCGSEDLEVFTEITIIKEDVMYRSISNIYLLKPSQRFEYSSNFSLLEGEYLIVARCIDKEIFKEFNSTIKVEKVYYPIYPIKPPSFVPAGIPIVRKYFYSVEVEYPRSLNVSQGDIIVFYIKLKNVGDLLTNLTLNFTNEIDLKLLFPKIIYKLSTNETAIFSVQANISHDKIGKYYPKFCIVSNEYSSCYTIEFIVSKSEIAERVEKLINLYENAIRNISFEVSILEKGGKNVTKIVELLNNASFYLLLAKNLYKNYLFEDSLKNIEKTKEFLSLSIYEISLLYLVTEKVPTEKIYYAIPFDFIFKIVFIVLLIILIIFAVKRIREYLKYREIFEFRLRRLKL